jgi:hypothetical protein
MPHFQITIPYTAHARKIGLLLEVTLGKKFDIVSSFKPNAPLANVVEALENLVKILRSRITLS